MNLPDSVKDKFETLKLARGTMQKICGHVANGGSMIDLAELWQVPYGTLLEWINADGQKGGRFELYQRAMTAQMYWAIDRILKELKHLGTVDIGEIYNARGGLLPMAEIPAEIRRCIAGVDSSELFEGVGREREQVGELKKVKMYDKIRALELMGKKFAMFIDRAQLDLTNKTIEELIDESWRADAIDGHIVAESNEVAAPPTPGEAGPASGMKGPLALETREIEGNSEVAKEKLVHEGVHINCECHEIRDGVIVAKVAKEQPDIYHGKA